MGGKEGKQQGTLLALDGTCVGHDILCGNLKPVGVIGQLEAWFAAQPTAAECSADEAAEGSHENAQLKQDEYLFFDVHRVDERTLGHDQGRVALQEGACEGRGPHEVACEHVLGPEPGRAAEPMILVVERIDTASDWNGAHLHDEGVASALGHDTDAVWV